ncbi:MAG: HupE/UreJ family protein [Deltaproteobacteria bacterium]|nr:HupE/UreJ family protein [Deltaproteobacteria bacterium]
MTYLTFTLASRDIQVTARIHRDDLAITLGRSPLERPTQAQALSASSRTIAYVSARLRVTQDTLACALSGESEPTIEPLEAPAFRLLIRYSLRCPRLIERLDLRDDLFFDLDDNHRAFASVSSHDNTRHKVFGVFDRTLHVDTRLRTSVVLREYVSLGTEHIVTGYDHLAFLLALLLSFARPVYRSQRIRRVLWVVTAFTLAHSVTLAMAALGVVRPPTRWIESAIALSIALVAAHEIHRILRTNPTSIPLERATTRPLIAALFGLVHGLGFAGALHEQGLPRSALITALAAFNLGVELGQLALVSVVFTALVWLSARLTRKALSFDRWVVLPSALALCALGLYWSAQRLFAN